ncbi:MAG: intradiol ring-cleavage dioxygenase [Dehalococcoidia bacterium]|nr:intradiol ring-cleavage dioxygenase [Dehalococcoidia bacterium]
MATAGGGSTASATATASSPATSVAPLEPTPACGDDDDDDATLAQTEGPYFTPNSPERASLIEAGVTGTKLVVSGFVVGTDCQPVAKAMLDFWQCDDAGVYDNDGYRLRGHQFADDTGRYALETILPGVYPGRTRHIHLKVQAPGRPVLTTQLYFPGEPGNGRDGIYNAALELEDFRDDGGGKAGRYTFVLQV